MSLINQIKKELRKGNTNSAIVLLRKTQDKSILREFKEQKLLLIPHNTDEFLSEYRSCACRLSGNKNEQEIELNYIQFCREYLRATQEIKNQIKALINPYLDKGFKSFLWQTNQHLTIFFDHLSIYFQNKFQTNKGEIIPSPEQLAKETESSIHILSAIANDGLFAFTCLANLFSEWQSEIIHESSDEPPKENIDVLVDALQLAGHLNSYQYALDKVSYGEWRVDHVNKINNKLIFKFSIIDIQLEIARDLGLKRMLSERFRPRKKRWLSEQLEDFAVYALDYAWNYYQDQSGLLIIDNYEYEKAKIHIVKILSQLNAEDELLVEINANNPVVISAYVTICVVLGFVVAADFLKKKSKRYSYRYSFPEIPKNEIEKILQNSFVGDNSIINSLDAFVTKLPIDYHIDLFKAPFLKIKDDKIIAFEYLSQSDWVFWIRSYLMQGGKIADKLGKHWEQYIAYVLKENNWQEVTERIKIRKNAKIVTDIDILVKLDYVLFIIQVKVHYGNGVNQYDQWKCKKKLIEGVQQAKLAEQAIKKDLDILKPHVKSFDLIKEVAHIQPLVVTNVHAFNGWVFDDVPILSTNSLMQIINGATVRFTTNDGTIVDEKKYANSECLSADYVLEFIKLPLDWRIGKPSYNVNYLEEDLGLSTLKLPLFESNYGISSLDFKNAE
jgi:predicted RecB family endonuclease